MASTSLLLKYELYQSPALPALRYVILTAVMTYHSGFETSWKSWLSQNSVGLLLNIAVVCSGIPLVKVSKGNTLEGDE